MKHKIIYAGILLLMLCILQNTFAQQSDLIQVSGTVVDENKEAMIGVSIFVKDQPGLGVTTDVNGNFKIKVKKNSTLVFSYVGYSKQEVEVEGV